jgi:hypothetical protein
MTSDPLSLADVDDEQLEALARHWRARAARGEKDAYGIAHSLEVELRSRARASRRAALTYTAHVSPRPWWNFWRRVPPRGQNAEGGV